MCTKHATVPSGILSPEHNRQKAAQHSSGLSKFILVVVVGGEIQLVKGQ